MMFLIMFQLFFCAFNEIQMSKTTLDPSDFHCMKKKKNYFFCVS